MSENAYLSRLKQLRDQKVVANEERMAPVLGRPLSRNAPGPGMGPGPAQPQQEEEQGPDMTSMFGKNFEAFQGEDKRFGQFMQEYTKLAEGLRQEVEQGFMPMPIAQQRLQSYVQDSQNYFRNNKATMMDNPQVAAMMEGALARKMEMAGVDPNAQGGAPQEGMPQEMPPQGGM